MSIQFTMAPKGTSTFTTYPAMNSDPIGPGQTWQIYMGSASSTGLPQALIDGGASGSAVITSDQNVVATVVTVHDGIDGTTQTPAKGHDFMYTAIPSTASTSAVVFPEFDNKTSGQWYGGIQIQNLGTTATTFTAVFSPEPDLAGQGATDITLVSPTIQPEGTYTWYAGYADFDAFAQGKWSAVITSDSGGDVNGTYTGRNDSVIGDSVGSYNGIALVAS
jgi:hypothetical protein